MIFVDNLTTLKRMVSALEGVPYLAVDTESNSLYAYYEHVCLIQLSATTSEANADNPQDYIIDPLTIRDLRPLGKLFANPETELIFHAAQQDVMSLKRDFGFQVGRLFDTQVGAKILGWKYTGLSTLLQQFFEIEHDKRFQQANWQQRPLSTEQLRYAQMDTHYLFPLRQIIAQELKNANKWDYAQEIFFDLTQVAPLQKRFDVNGFWKLKGVGKLNNDQVAILRTLYIWREKKAQAMDYPPFKVIRNEVLVEMAFQSPETLEGLGRIKGIPAELLRREGQMMLKAIRKGQNARPPRRQTHRRPNTVVLARYNALYNWRKHKAQQDGLDSYVILPKEALWAIAHQNPTSMDELIDIQHVGIQRRDAYGQEILDVLAKIQENE